MKKLIAILLALVLALSLTVPASAATTMRWDWGKAQASIGNVAAQIVREQQPEPTDVPETEYTVVEETEADIYTENEPEPVAETIPEREQSWRYWFRNWDHWIRYERE
mgnify:CR=1 FL=1